MNRKAARVLLTLCASCLLALIFLHRKLKLARIILLCHFWLLWSVVPHLKYLFAIRRLDGMSRLFLHHFSKYISQKKGKEKREEIIIIVRLEIFCSTWSSDSEELEAERIETVPKSRYPKLPVFILTLPR